MKLHCNPPTTHAPKLVFLHGMGGTGSLWRPIAARLEDEFAILAPDQRGHGASQDISSHSTLTSPSFTPQDYGQDVIDTMNFYEFHPACIVGHSMGVRSAVAAAHLQPQLCKGLVLIDLGFEPPTKPDKVHSHLARFLREIPESFSTREEARQYMHSKAPDPSIGQYLLAVSVKGAGGDVHFPFDKEALLQTLEQASKSPVRTWLLGLAASGLPVLLLRGAKSHVWEEADYQENQKAFATYPQVQFKTYENAGHGLPFEQKERFITDLKDFYKSLSSRPQSSSPSQIG